MSGLAALGRAVAERQDRLREQENAKEDVRRALFERPVVPAARASRRLAVAMALAAVAIGVCVLFVVKPWGRETVVAGSFHEASSEPRVLHFTDGTQVTLERGAAARVDRVDEQGATIALERGALFAEVVPRPGAQWSFRAGPYVVRVTGTAFDLSWTPPTMTIVMHEGRVVVTGPDLPEPREIVAGEQAVFPPVVAEAKKKHASPAHKPVDDPPPTKTVPQDGWQGRAARGDYHGAYAQVAPRLDDELASLDAASLLRLATVARLSGHADVSQRVYLRLRERFPATPSATEAAFSLGTMAFSSNGAEAERWFRVALLEAPSDGVAAAARGRLLELAVRRGDAKSEAAEYLRQHPDGPHAALARDVLSR
jgi:hypothetical protein